ncbi:hypothetical protein BDP27DRAFT_800964 [Rhodocollybia butyracea]|uniref:F-box domain-containing protein n=1 Tax=Rhodocollybia butyracea TaxID=206335 RepID=A0A9P5Q6S8_9AGAR|nr:hypothetical protein BDP27DRAFT_800964 [Rhodocollybia butyracea]
MADVDPQRQCHYCCFAVTTMEAVIYDDYDFNLHSPFDFEATFDSLVSSSRTIENGDLNSFFALPPRPSSPSMDVLPLDSDTKDMEYSFSVEYVHETDLRDSRFVQFKRQSRFRFSPRRIDVRMVKLTSPVSELLGSNIYPPLTDVASVEEIITNLQKHCEALEDDLFLLQSVLHQLSKAGMSLAYEIGVHKSFFVPSHLRIALIAPQIPFLPETPNPSHVYIKDITFKLALPEEGPKPQEFTTHTIRFPISQYLNLPSVGSNIDDLLRSETAPTDDLHGVQEMLRIAEAAYQKVAQNIHVLYRIVDRLEMEVDLVRQHMFLHSALLAPVHRCPNEILIHIFWYCYMAADSPSDVDVSPLPLVLGGVNARWRDVVKALPWLWSTIQIQVNVQTFSPRVIRGFVEWLERTGQTYPLSLRVIFVTKHTVNWRSQNDSDWTREDLWKNHDAAMFYATIEQYASRWSKLEFLNCPLRLLEGLIEVLRNRTPILQSLTIDTIGISAFPGVEFGFGSPIWTLQKGVRLTLSRDPSISASMINVFDLSGIQSLTLTDAIILRSLPLTLEALSHCKSLEKCEMCYTGREFVAYPSIPRNLSTVVDLSVTMERPDMVLSFMTLPSLRRLKFSFTEDSSHAKHHNKLLFVKELFNRSRLVCSSGRFEPCSSGCYEFYTSPLGK